MSSLKKIGIVLGLGGIVVIGYYFLNKSKPVIAAQQLTQLGNTSVTPVNEQLEKPLSVEDKLIEDKCSGLSRSEAIKCANEIKASTSGVLSNVTVTPLQSSNNTSTSNVDVFVNPVVSTPTTTSGPRGTIPGSIRTISGGRRL